jgi:uncharacterized membrane protein YdbT with pleckstrin-like domain
VAFPTKLLNEREEIVLDLRPHWLFLFGPAAAVVAAGAAAIAFLVVDLHDYVFLASLGAVVLAVLWLIGRWAKWVTTNFVVTTDRLIYRSGVVAKRGMEIPLERVNNIAFNQSVRDRLLRCGDLLIESAGESGQQKFTDIAKPSQVQNEIYRQMEASVARDADRMAGRRELSIPEQIEKLDELRSRGVISQAEFEAKKAQLLDRL